MTFAALRFILRTHVLNTKKLIYRFWLLALIFLITACGQPLQIESPTAGGMTSPPSITDQADVPTFVAGESPAAGTALLPEATEVSTPTVLLTPVPTPLLVNGTAVVVVPTFMPNADSDPWAAQQAEREDFGSEQTYIANAPVSLLWYDPVTGQNLEIGRMVGRFRVTAHFLLKSSDKASALAVPYRINQDYGLTAISPAVIDRMRTAGAIDSVEAYVLSGDTIAPVAASSFAPHFSQPSYVLASSNRVGALDL